MKKLTDWQVYGVVKHLFFDDNSCYVPMEKIMRMTDVIIKILELYNQVEPKRFCKYSIHDIQKSLGYDLSVYDETFANVVDLLTNQYKVLELKKDKIGDGSGDTYIINDWFAKLIRLTGKVPA